jgi:hypothetical protein
LGGCTVGEYLIFGVSLALYVAGLRVNSILLSWFPESERRVAERAHIKAKLYTYIREVLGSNLGGLIGYLD